MKRKIDMTHPDYDRQIYQYGLWQNLYDGGEAIEGKPEYLPQHPLETQKQYAIRLARSCYRNLVAPIPNAFHSAVWRKNPARKLPIQLQDIQNNVDLANSSADEFFRAVSQIASVKGVCFIGVDSKRITAPIMNVEEQKRLGLRPYFTIIEPEDVLDWQFSYSEDANAVGELEWVKVRETVQVRRDVFSEAGIMIGYRVWYRDRWELYKELSDEKKPVLIDEGEVSINEVPIVPLFFKRVKNKSLIGSSPISWVAKLMLRVYWNDSEYDKALFDQAVALLFGRGIPPNELENFVRSTSNGFFTNNPEASLQYIEPSGNSFAHLAARIDKYEKSIAEIALRLLKPDSKAAMSAESRKLDKIQTDDNFAAFSKNCQDAEVKCWKLAARWFGIGGDDIVCEYNVDFDPETIDLQTVQMYLALLEKKVISKQVVRECLKKGEILPMDYDPKTDDLLIESDIASAASIGMLEV